jgi:Holliday junction resolvase RusA-like endonuclease
MADLEFFIPGNPSGKGRPRFARQGQFVRTYTPRETEAYESNIRLFAAEAMNGSPPTGGPVAVAQTRRRIRCDQTGTIR